ncbi:energy transducer TonB [Tunicatimonas pelagia]|uniref:energy transducer TonB n=1 Tax=Tunicatimonas pelagia TaxID=931531 RepID=UPI0026650D37|nr:energy transducer TonB [Tunicatimonas pelagia]WKN41748.1 TonB family protein [Tunicatimonas pelagia]
MKYLFVFGLCIANNLSSWAQDTVYFNKDWQEVSDWKDAAYKRLMKRTAVGWYINDFYYPSDRLQMEGEVSSLTPPILEGYCVHYYHNGNKKREGGYKGGRPIGLHKEYHPSGQTKTEIDYQTDGLYVDQVWAETGEPLLQEGNGEYEDVNADGDKVYQKIRKHGVALSYTVRTQELDTLYSVAEQMPEYPGGYDRLYRFVRKKLKYPKVALRARIQGVVYVHLIVNKTGEITEVNVIENIGAGCGKEAKRIIERLKTWKPGEVNGKPVKTPIVLPIAFKLKQKRIFFVGNI